MAKWQVCHIQMCAFAIGRKRDGGGDVSGPPGSNRLDSEADTMPRPFFGLTLIQSGPPYNLC